jgi:all-trans-8'-apo-beta-carotenal 15,15'-oxygenase
MAHRLQVVEFPVISPAVVGRRHSYAYCVGDIVRDEVMWGPFQSVVKVCLPQGGSTAPRDGKPQSAQQGVLKSETYEPGPRSFVGEPMFVPRYDNTAWRPHQFLWPRLVDRGELMPSCFSCFRPGALDEDDGWIIVGVHNAESMLGEIHILDAQR